MSDTDRAYIEQAIECAKQQSTSLAPAVFEFLRSILLLEGDDSDTTIYGYRKKLYFTLKFQQLTGPVMAKGLEDTACYVYTRFISANEVGGSPADFGISVGEFHEANQERAEHWPHSMLSTSTHDTKRSEDVRARLDVLSEMPGAWASQVMKWRRINRARKVKLSDGRVVPDSNEEYLLYQTSAWSVALVDTNQAGARRFLWTHSAVHGEGSARGEDQPQLAESESRICGRDEFVPGGDTLANLARQAEYVLGFAGEIHARPIIYFGLINSLSQTLLKLTCPGVPDIYQGQEMWDFSLVDPDNRRPVDFELRQRLLDELSDGF